MTEPQWWQRMTDATRRSAWVFLRDVGHGLLDVSHNMLALVGLLVVASVIFAASRPDLRVSMEQQAYDWLQVRFAPPTTAEAELPQMPDDPEAKDLAHALAIDPKTLNRQQAVVTSWLSRRYRVAPEPVARLVQEAWHVGQRNGLDPTLILAIVAIESSFNPFAQSSVGAQGLMQVMTRVHNEKYEQFGGSLSAFDPVANLRVGVQVLRECISRAGGLEAGLRYYVGAANSETDGGYAARVLAEQRNLRRVAAGQAVSIYTSNNVLTSNAANTPAPTQPQATESASPSAAPAASAAPSAKSEQLALAS